MPAPRTARTARTARSATRARLGHALSLALTAGALAAAGSPSMADPARDPHDYPTSERVLWVEACMRDHPGPHYEMLNKCACALDEIARTVTFDDFDTLNTAANATTMAGERGSLIRDAPDMQERLKAWRKLQAQVQSHCLFPPPPAR